MNKLVVPLAAAFLALSAGLASADEASGKIQSVKGNMITLENGEQFTLSTDASMEGLEPGAEVTVSYEEKDGQKVAKEVKPKAE